jgi:hypothetical protein
MDPAATVKANSTAIDRTISEPLVIPLAVIVLDGLADDSAKMALTERKHLADEFRVRGSQRIAPRRRSDSGSGRAAPQVDHEEHEVPHESSPRHDFDRKELRSVDRTPMGSQKGLPSHVGPAIRQAERE